MDMTFPEGNWTACFKSLKLSKLFLPLEIFPVETIRYTNKDFFSSYKDILQWVRQLWSQTSRVPITTWPTSNYNFMTLVINLLVPQFSHL